MKLEQIFAIADECEFQCVDSCCSVYLKACSNDLWRGDIVAFANAIEAAALPAASAQQAEREALSTPEIGSMWKHRNGPIYTVTALFNEHTEHPDKYPVSVAYVGPNGRTWVRPLHDWHRSMTFVRAAPSAGNGETKGTDK